MLMQRNVTVMHQIYIYIVNKYIMAATNVRKI